MPSPPVDDHTEEFEQLAGLSALDVLEGEDRERFDRHVAACERCQLMLRLDREALENLLLTAPEIDPSPDFKARLMQRGAEELATTRVQAPRPSSGPIPGPPRPANLVPFWRRTAWTRALAAVLVIGLVTAGAFGYENQVVATYDMTGSLPGSARVVVRRSGAASLEMRDVPDPGPGFLYELWVIPPGQQPIPIDTTSSGTTALNLPGNLQGSTVAITRETRRVDVPTPPVLLATEVRS
jgi:anti-sigma-K factor RskA